MSRTDPEAPITAHRFDVRQLGRASPSDSVAQREMVTSQQSKGVSGWRQSTVDTSLFFGPRLRQTYFVVDSLTREQRSRNMQLIRGKDTRPELSVRRYLHNLGYRYTLHDPSLAGKPDIVFAARRKAIFINGCFWHSHGCRFGTVKPKTNAEFWQAKRTRTVQRDSENRNALTKDGWNVLTLWECEIVPTFNNGEVLVCFLGAPRHGNADK